LREEPDRLRRIITGVYGVRGKEGRIYQVHVAVCNRMYTMYFPTQGVSPQPIVGHTDPCSDLELPDREEVRRFVLEHLESSGIDPSRDVRQSR
jgi:hypothetical protein